jgi:hypothetical protein
LTAGPSLRFWLVIFPIRNRAPARTEILEFRDKLLYADEQN